MKAGDYAKTKKGIIGKIKAIDNQTELEDLYLVKKKWYYKEDISKSSSEIIDLIEVGDYVNGLQVYETGTFGHNGKTFCRLYGNVAPFYEEDIKSIVTREMFESMEYKVGE